MMQWSAADAAKLGGVQLDAATLELLAASKSHSKKKKKKSKPKSNSNNGVAAQR